MTGRPGKRPNAPVEISDMWPWERVESILSEGWIGAFNTYYSAGHPVVCLSEFTATELSSLIGVRDYEPWGILFDREAVWSAGGGPVMYVRKDEWHHAGQAPEQLRSRMVRTELGEEDWSFEHEWRILGRGDPPGWSFEPEAVVGVLVGDREWMPMELDYDLEHWVLFDELQLSEQPADWAVDLPAYEWTGTDWAALE